MTPEQSDKTKKHAISALRRVCITLPALVGLAHFVQVEVSTEIDTASVSNAGRVFLNPEFWLSLSIEDATFVMAHELMHLALASHQRASSLNAVAFNIAHDYIINDILREELAMDVPADGLWKKGARFLSAEQLVSEMAASEQNPSSAWKHANTLRMSGSALGTALGKALAKAGLAPQTAKTPEKTFAGDLVIEQAPSLAERCTLTQQIANEALRLQILHEASKRQESQIIIGSTHGTVSNLVEALRAYYRTPWQLALQRWFDDCAPAERTYARASRKHGHRTDIVLPGRKRDGWTLTIILDTSGSMTESICKALGAIQSFGEQNNVQSVRMIQCDTEISVDERIELCELTYYRIQGFGGSDMSPALSYLEQEHATEACIIISDGYVDVPQEPPSFAVLWAIVDSSVETMPFGEVIQLEVL